MVESSDQGRDHSREGILMYDSYVLATTRERILMYESYVLATTIARQKAESWNMEHGCLPTPSYSSPLYTLPELISSHSPRVSNMPQEKTATASVRLQSRESAAPGTEMHTVASPSDRGRNTEVKNDWKENRHRHTSNLSQPTHPHSYRLIQAEVLGPLRQDNIASGCWGSTRNLGFFQELRTTSATTLFHSGRAVGPKRPGHRGDIPRK